MSLQSVHLAAPSPLVGTTITVQIRPYCGITVDRKLGLGFCWIYYTTAELLSWFAEETGGDDCRMERNYAEEITNCLRV